MAEIHGESVPGFELVAAAFESAFEGRPQMGAAVAIRHRGEAVVDLWGGVADRRTGAEWVGGTATVVFSCTKALVSILAARLVQEGRLDYDARVAEYWPQFASAGKGDVRIRDLLSHRAGLSAPRVDLTLDEIVAWDPVVRALERQEPLWRPGSAHGYHTLTHGWLIGEVIRRITGTSVGTYFSEAIAQPLLADAWLGLPEHATTRVAHLHAAQMLLDEIREVSAARSAEEVDWNERATTLGGAIPESFVTDDGGFNDRRLQAAEIPGAGAIGTARALATIMSATVIETDGVRLLDDAVVARATQVQSDGASIDGEPPPWARWGMGFLLDSEAGRFTGERAFGHGGVGGQLVFADPDNDIGFAFVTNHLEGKDDPRAIGIVDALRATLVR